MVGKYRKKISNGFTYDDLKYYGYDNAKFRNEIKKFKKENIIIEPSKRYMETKIKKSKLERKVARQRKHHMENMILDVVRNASFIGIETLSVTDMYVKKNKSKK